ncbi:hypothetical protein FIU86_11285 [Roseovarius sp. THAF9]|uniref:DUF4864 domain-containing protein n=1 Tax=Roseovarius sp. THAF9 TaxID=2587847 RepID=UPI0012690BC0|nr:DUF4864 domain-containing protein [Roseovarius sp. THAF9]QFT93424.1 hypothetical protein FIU86_11285 [Roseovarius sp. THAF9]
MTRFLSFLVVSFLLAMPARADDAARQVISDQLDAFQQDDFDTAFTHASPMIQGIFGSSERFGQMVRNGYPMVWRPAEVEFLGERDEGDALMQDVLIQGADGVYYELEYEMIQGPGGWKINGVRVKSTGEGLA